MRLMCRDYFLRCSVSDYFFLYRFGIEGIIRTFTGDGPEGMSGHGKNLNGPPHINCHAGGADEDKASSRSAARAKKQRSGGKCACTGCSVM